MGFIGWDIVTQNLGAKPVEALSQRTGDWTLRFLMIVLLVTPLCRVTGKAVLMRYRRMLGLYAFFYACLHFIVYVALDLYFSPVHLVEDIVKRPYIIPGFLAFILMLPLVATSTRQMMRALGKRWKKIHQLVYVVAILAVVHFVWMAGEGLMEPLIYTATLAVLLGYRMWVYKLTR